MSTAASVTSELYWLSAGLLAMIDITALYCLSQSIASHRFREAKVSTTVVSILFWGGLWAALMANNYVWETVYSFVFSRTERWTMPVIIAVIYGLIGLGLWWAASKLPFNPVVSFAVLGGLVSLPNHLYAIYVKNVLDTPLLRNVSAASGIIFGIFEFTFYWIVILSIAVFARSITDWWTQGRQNLFNHMMRP